MAAEIETERLRLRPFQVDDLEAFVAYRSDPEVARYQSWDASYSMTDAQSFLTSQRQLELGQPGEWLQLAIVDRRTGSLCGDCGVRVEIDPPATAEVGVTLAPSRQNEGLATEALAAVVTALFAQQGMHRVFAEADDRNAPVKRLLERLDFRCEARLVEADWFKGEWSTLCVYAILDREWQAGQQGSARTQRVSTREPSDHSESLPKISARLRACTVPTGNPGWSCP